MTTDVLTDSTSLGETLKIRLYPTAAQELLFDETAYQYMLACNDVSDWIFSHDMCLNAAQISIHLYHHLRETYHLKAQLAQSVIKTVAARYKTVNAQLKQKPCRFEADGQRYSFQRDINWLNKPIRFSRPQCDLVRGRDYSFVHSGKDGALQLSINTLQGRVKCNYASFDYMQKFFQDGWKFGTAKLVEMNGIWFLHIGATKEVKQIADEEIKHVVGIDRGLRFLAATYDEKQKTMFYSGKEILKKRDKFDAVRAELQAKGTKSAKRVLKRISGRENRWMSDVNHSISKALVHRYESGTVFVLEDLTGVSFEEANLHGAKQSHNLRSWSFYDLETKLTYKAKETGSKVVKVDPSYTSQRCPHCGAIVKENRHHDTHEYICSRCGFRSNDDRVGAMNIYLLGTLYVSCVEMPAFRKAVHEKGQPVSINS